MSLAAAPPRSDPRWVRLGGFLFRARGWIPLPLLILLLIFAQGLNVWALPGALVVLAGLGLRLWAVAHIGPGSRRRTAEVGALAASGPYTRCRNPLYVGNLALWVGVSLLSGAPWVALPVFLGLFLHYTAVVRWEEQLLGETLGEAYRAWAARTPRWIPHLGGGSPEPGASPSGSWRAAWRSERSTHLAALVVIALVVGVGQARGGA